ETHTLPSIHPPTDTHTNTHTLSRPPPHTHTTQKQQHTTQHTHNHTHTHTHSRTHTHTRTMRGPIFRHCVGMVCHCHRLLPAFTDASAVRRLQWLKCEFKILWGFPRVPRTMRKTLHFL